MPCDWIVTVGLPTLMVMALAATAAVTTAAMDIAVIGLILMTAGFIILTIGKDAWVGKRAKEMETVADQRPL